MHHYTDETEKTVGRGCLAAVVEGDAFEKMAFELGRGC